MRACEMWAFEAQEGSYNYRGKSFVIDEHDLVICLPFSRTFFATLILGDLFDFQA